MWLRSVFHIVVIASGKELGNSLLTPNGDHINADTKTTCIRLLAMMTLALLIYRFFPMKGSSSRGVLGSNLVDVGEYESLVHEEKWELLFDDKYLAWEIRVGDAFISITDNKTMATAFVSAKSTIGDKRTQSQQRKKVRRAMLLLLRRHTSALLTPTSDTSVSGGKKKVNDFPDLTKATLITLWQLLPLYIDAICLYKNKACPSRLISETGFLVNAIIHRSATSIKDSKRLIELILQLHVKSPFPSALIKDWILLLGDGNVRKTGCYFLDRCKSLVARGEWQKALLQYMVHAQGCSCVRDEEIYLLVRMKLHVTLQNITNKEMLHEAFALTTHAVSKNAMSRTEKTQLISLLFDVFEAHVKTIVSPNTAIDVDFLRRIGGIEMNIDFLAQLEICSVWRKFLQACKCSGASPVFLLFKQLIQRERSHRRAKRMESYVKKHSLGVGDYSPSVPAA